MHACKWLTFTAVTATEAFQTNSVSLPVTGVVPHFIVLCHAKRVTVLCVIVRSTHHPELESNGSITIFTVIGCSSSIPILTWQDGINGEGIHQVIRTGKVDIDDLNVNLCSSLYKSEDVQW